MPTISIFYGISIMMHMAKKEHNPPHIHARYGDQEAAFFISNGEMYEGYLPARAKKMVKEFILMYQKELYQMWDTGDFMKLKGID